MSLQTSHWHPSEIKGGRCCQIGGWVSPGGVSLPHPQRDLVLLPTDRAKTLGGCIRPQERLENPLDTSFLWAGLYFCVCSLLSHTQILVPAVIGPWPAFQNLGSGGGCAFSKDGLFSSPLGLSFLLSPGAKRCAFPVALLKSCLVIICRPETGPLLFGLLPKYSLFSWCVVQYLQVCAQLGYLCNRSKDFISSPLFLSYCPSK